MKEDIKCFVEDYNKRMDWNVFILDRLLKVYNPILTKDLLDEHLSTKKITEDRIDLENAKIHIYGNGVREMQAFNNETLGTTYFWVKPDETEMEYKKKKINSIKKYVTGRKEELENKIEELYAENKELSFIESVCDKTLNLIK